MKKIWMKSLFALLLAPLVSQAGWINTLYWPYIYRYEGNWEYSYTPGFWTWDYDTGEYHQWGEPVSAIAPQSAESLKGMEISMGSIFVFLDGPNYKSNGPVFASPRDGVYDPIIDYSYQLRGPDESVLLLLIEEASGYQIGRYTVLLELKFTTPSEGNVTYTSLSSDFNNTHVGSFSLHPYYVVFTPVDAGDLTLATGNYQVGPAWGDYDTDGFPDLYLPNWNGTHQLFHNEGDGTFSRVLTGDLGGDTTVLTGDNFALTPVWCDFDNDGDLDLFVAHYSATYSDRYYRNDGDGNFTRITDGEWVNDNRKGMGVACGDFDNDGWVDLFVANTGPGYNFLYRNNGDGSMIPVNADFDYAPSHGAAFTDYDGDGFLDLFICRGPLQWHNNGDGTFTNVSDTPAAIPPEAVRGRIDESVASADYDNDGDLDIFIVNASQGTGTGQSRLYRNDGGTFTDATLGDLADHSCDYSGCATWGDFDNDGFIDLFIANFDLATSDYLYHNNGDGSFTRVTEGPIVENYDGTWGAAWADYDNDGDLDLITVGGWDVFNPLTPVSPRLYRNEGNENNWIAIKLVGTRSNRSGIGAKVRVKATIGGKDVEQLREISASANLHSQSDIRAHFGLGDAAVIEQLRIEWPSGVNQVLTDIQPNQFLEITEPVM
jgi:hypothetical protein